MSIAGVQDALNKQSVTILKDNISWHFPFLSANTTPWQLEGTVLGLKGAGFQELAAVHNNTVVTDPVKGGHLNKLNPIYKRYKIPEKYNFRTSDMAWRTNEPKAKMRVLKSVPPRGYSNPGLLSREKCRASSYR